MIKNNEYWKAEGQISKPADKKTIEEFINNLPEEREFRPWKRYLLRTAGILLLIIILYNALFSAFFSDRNPKISIIPGFSFGSVYSYEDEKKEKKEEEREEKKEEEETNIAEKIETMIAGTAQDTANEEEQEPFEYEIQDGRAVITKYVGKETDVVIPDELGGATEIIIGNGAFYNSLVTSVTMSNSVVGIGWTYGSSSAFGSCISLERVYIPGRVNTIPLHAFKNCVSLKEVVMEEGILTLDMGCFEGCISLKELTIPRSVTEIEIEALKGTGITELTVSPECWVKDTVETVNYYE